MVRESEIHLELECKVYDAGEVFDAGDKSSVRSGSFAGWVSLTSDDLSLDDEAVFELLDVAHAEYSFVKRFLKLHNAETGCLEKLGVRGDFETDDEWFSGSVSTSYLNDCIGSMDGGESVVESVCEFADNITVYSSEE